MKRLYDQFTQTDFYQQREEAILRRLQKAPLISPPLSGKRESQLHDPSDVIYYTGCVAGSLGLPLDGDNVSAYLTLLRNHAVDGEWPEIARLISELYARANDEVVTQINADPILAQQPWALHRMSHKSPMPTEFEGCTVPSNPEFDAESPGMLPPV